jgi:bifunctional DNA-binding transcriptional regulator/antitoxin component of YhaV-PrlF toxin-antitoxin module
MSGQLKVANGGRVVVPQEVREYLGIEIGKNVSYSVEDGRLMITTPQAALRRLQEFVKGSVPQGESIVDELIRERREEAERE